MRLERYDIFLSYIREDTGGWTGMLYRSLSDNLPTYRIFKDDEETTAGTQWAPRLERLVRRCDFFILVVSKQWSAPEIKSALADPDNWVRREVKIALASKKQIIPVLVNGAMSPTGLPTEIQTAIDDHQCFSFSQGTSQWDQEANQLCEQITKEVRGSHISDTLTRLFAPLDRYHEAPWVRTAVKDGHAAFAVCGGVKDEPLVFAQRCGDEINADARLEQAFDGPAELQWKPYAANSEPSLRKQDLLHAIARGSALDVSAKQERELKSFFQKNEQTLVFFTVVQGAGRLTDQRIVEWLGIWKALLAGCRTGSVLVLLFVPRNWLLVRRSRLPTPPCKAIERLQRKGLGVIKRDDVDLFIDKLAHDGRLSNPQKSRLQRANKRLFMLPIGRRLKMVKETIAPILTTQ